jgi:PiT family inorganic phosphate transporter
MTMPTEVILSVVIFAALIFTLTNGMHDASSVVATFIACGAASPLQIIIWAAACSFTGALVSGSAVSNTISSIVDIPAGTALLKVLLAAMTGAVIWNAVTRLKGFPSSSTHALVGGLVGAVWMARGPQFIVWGGRELIGPGHHLIGVSKIVAALIIAPVLGFTVAFLLQKVSNIVLRNAKYGINSGIKRMQWILGGFLAYSQGGNDTQKIVGIILLALASANHPFGPMASVWIKGLGGSVMFTGTLLGGWSIMKTVGRGIYTIRPIHSLNSQLASGSSILLATALGAPVSTTHVVVGSVMGVGGADEFRMVNWKIGKEIIIAWCITMPVSAIVAAGAYYLLRFL